MDYFSSPFLFYTLWFWFHKKEDVVILEWPEHQMSMYQLFSDSVAPDQNGFSLQFDNKWSDNTLKSEMRILFPKTESFPIQFLF